MRRTRPHSLIQISVERIAIGSFLNPRFGSGVFGLAMHETKIKIPQINWQRQQVLQHADRVMPINRKVTQHQKRAQRTALPKTEWNHTFFGALGCYPLNQEAHSENPGAEPADNFPWRNGQATNLKRSQKMKGIHSGRKLRQIVRSEQLFVVALARASESCQK